jgi:CheY-like chemotaxis protein
MCTLVSEPRRAAEMGATGYLTKPILETDLVLALKRLQSPAPPALARQVLVMDSNPAAADFVRGALRLSGAPACDVITAADGLSGLASARQHRPAAIILDLLLPGLDGYEVLAELRDDAATRDIPVLVMTNAELSQRERERLSRQVSCLREKRPLTEEQLLQDLQRALGSGA